MPVETPTKKKKVVLRIAAPCSVLARDSILTMPVTYGRVVTMRGTKTVIVVCEQYSLPATYSLTANGVAKWEGYCSAGHPGLKKLVDKGLDIPAAKLRKITKAVFKLSNDVAAAFIVKPTEQ